MQTRFATKDDASEVVRLAAILFESMGVDAGDPEWQELGRRQVEQRLGSDVGVFVVDHPESPGRLVASAAGVVGLRLPTPFNSEGKAGYVQWVCTDSEFRGQGLGRLVMVALLEWFDAQGVGTVELHSTPIAESLYLSLGFDDSGPRALRRRRW